MLGVAAVSTFGSIYVRLAAETTINFSKIALIYIVIENIVNATDKLRAVLVTMVLGGLIPAVGTIYNYLTHQHLVQGRGAFYGVFANPNEVAYSLVILVPLAAVLAWRSNWLKRIFFVAVIGIYLVATYVTFSRGGLMGLAAVLALLGLKQKSFVAK